MLRAAKHISACAALTFRRSVFAVKALSGFAALIHRPNVPVLIPDDAIASISDCSPSFNPAILPTPQNEESELEQSIRAIVSLAKQEVAEILPGWSIDIDAFVSPAIRCHEIVLRAETPEKWGWRHHDDGYVVEGRQRQVWGARLPICYDEIFCHLRDKTWLLQHILGKLCEFARDIRRKAPAPSARPCLRPFDGKPM